MTKSCSIKGHQKLFFLDFGQVASCCKAYPMDINSSTTLQDCIKIWNDEKELLSQGIEIPSCDYCWKAEHTGVKSHRQLVRSAGSEVIEFFISNLCNQMCNYCSPKFSSQWNESIMSDGNFVSISQSAQNNLKTKSSIDINKEEWLDQIKHYINTRDDRVLLRFLGGEPLMQLNTLKFFQELDYNKISSIEINTNLNPPTNKFLTWVINNIPKEKLKMTISLDATPEYNHVPRGLFDQNTFLENLKLIQLHNIDFKIASVISVLSIFDLPNFIKWLENQNLKLQRIVLNNPECLLPKYVPLTIREKIWNTIKNSEYASQFEQQLRMPESAVDIKLFEQYNYLNQYFTRVNITPLEIDNIDFQYYWSWLRQRYNK